MEYEKEFTTEIVIKKNIQSFVKLGLNVIFLRYAANPHINKKIKLLIPSGIPKTTSLNNPATKINP